MLTRCLFCNKYSPIGYPTAKSLLCVQNIANIPALPKLIGLPTNRVTTITEIKTMVLDMRIDNRNIQFTLLRFNSAMDIKIKDGNENVPTNVFIPLASVSLTRFMRPAKYLQKYKVKQKSNTPNNCKPYPQIIIAKHCVNAG